MKSLPVDALLPELHAKLRQHPAIVLEAPPGSGKTTRVAPSLVDADLCDSKRKTFLLQPRRVAAKATAQRIAAERKWQLGGDVGYQVRFDNKTKSSTALIVATEGILLRRLANDPAIEDVGTVILDEFHERSLNADLLISMLRQVQQLIREDLRIIVMSATLDSKPLCDYLEAPILKTTGTLHPVDIKYRPPKPKQHSIDHIVETISLTAEKTDGDVLVFLPGVGEIHRVEKGLQQTRGAVDCRIMPLHGSMPLNQQTEVLNAGDRRRIVLATNVAETSLTIEGIRCVIDSGQARVLRFDPAVGLDRLQLEPISRSSATQRAGRAGRLAEGTCIRLWDEKSHRARVEHLEPEIRRVDLAGALLQLYQCGERPSEFPWFEPPRDESMETATRLLELLGAVEDDRITELGKEMAAIPASPRLSRMLIDSRKSGSVGTVSLLAAMLSERDPFVRSRDTNTRRQGGSSSSDKWNCDLTQRLVALRRFYSDRVANTPFGEIHRAAAHSIRRVADQFESIVGKENSPASRGDSATTVARALLVAFPDRLAKRRKPGSEKGIMVGGRGVQFGRGSRVVEPELFLCVDVDGRSTDATVRQACGVDFELLDPAKLDSREELFFNPTRKQVEARQRTYWLDLMLQEQTSAITDDSACRDLLFQQASKILPQVMPDEKSAFHSYLCRWQCLAEWAPEIDLPPIDDELLKDVLFELCAGKRSLAELRSAPWMDWLKSKLKPEQQKAIEKECPERLTVPSGSRIKIDYVVGKAPVLAVRIQEVFSWTATPKIAFGRQPLLLHLLAPNYRPQQVTDDLASFWANTYEVVRKELRRRYPKHAWPEDPLTAKPECKGGRRH